MFYRVLPTLPMLMLSYFLSYSALLYATEVVPRNR